jgi:LCP family protein required for cell wall assembly
MSDQHSVDFLQQKYEVPVERVVRAKVSRTGKYVAGVLIVGALVGVFFSYKIANITHGDEADVGNLSIFATITHGMARLVGSPDRPLVGEESDRINFLLMGVGGTGHDGPQLADTMMFGSFKPSTAELGLLSIPRDLYVAIPGYNSGKINHANAYGEMGGKGQGLKLSAEVVGDVMAQPIDYTIRVDFDGFTKLIDQLGGVDIYVDHSFDDYQFPEYEGSPTYKTLHFTEGNMHMDSEMALDYARSRHGNNGEGTDYARAARQQKILMAVKDKALSLGVLLNPIKLTKLFNTVSSNITTDLSIWEMIRLAKYVPNIDTKAIVMQVLDTAPGSPLYSTTTPTAGFIILPKSDNWSEVQQIAANLFVSAGATASASAPATLAATTAVKVEIQNGTMVSGLAYQTSARLAGSSFEVVSVGNAAVRDVERTTIYDLTNGRKAAELATLKQFLGADVVLTDEGWTYADNVVPTSLQAISDNGEAKTSEKVDFLIVVGQDATSLVLK